MFASSDRIAVRPGDVFLVPGGLTHAIGEGIFMIEIMEPTDYAVRLEFERGGFRLPEESRFMGRDVDFALDLIDFAPRSVPELRDRYFCRPASLDRQGRSREWSLVDSRYTDCFRVKHLSVQESFEKQEPIFYVGIVSKGCREHSHASGIHRGSVRGQILCALRHGFHPVPCLPKAWRWFSPFHLTHRTLLECGRRQWRQDERESGRGPGDTAV